jgi:hypothetical protein
MSKLLRLTLVLLAVLATAFLWSGQAIADPVPPSAEDCAADSALEGCPQPNDPVVTDGDSAAGESNTGDAGASDTGAGGTDTGRAQAAELEAELPAALAVPCDALPGIGLPPCGPPNCDALPSDLLPDCAPAPPPTCDRLPELPGLPFCQFPDSDCPPPTPPGAVTAAAVTDEQCTPPLTCDQFAQLFGFGDDCGDIPLCIPRDRVPAGFPLPVPSPPLCSAGAGGTPPASNPPPVRQPTQQPQQQVQPPPTVHYANCDDARAKGKAPVYSTDPGYEPHLDSDHDGIGCEDETQYAVTATDPQPTGKLAYTGYDLESQLTVAWTLLMAGGAALILGRRRA